MKKELYILILLSSLITSGSLQAQTPRKLTEATISYDIVINTSDTKPQAADLLDCVRTQNYSLTGRFFKHAREIVNGSLRFNIMCDPYALTLLHI